MNNDKEKYNLLIASYLEPEHIEKISQVAPERFNVIFEPDLIGAPRYPADHYAILDRTPEQEARWRELLGEADIIFDFDVSNRADLPDLAPNLRWLQATSAGIGQFIKRQGYDVRMPDTIFTTASGVHARPLAEYVIMTMLTHYKGLLLILDQQRDSSWQRMAGTDLEGRTLAVVGLGRIGRETARMARALGMKVVGTDLYPNPESVDQFFELENIREMLPLADVVVLSVPHTPDTEKMIAEKEFAAMQKGAYFINIARGAVVDELELIKALESGQLAGAALDVFEKEPLPAESPLWRMPNVIVSPHSASTSDRENLRLTELLCDNMQRYLDNEPLRNVLNTELLF
ncbi:MAG: D-2-hydroxyacid dehydrogenase [Anaerolineaceae bacterium]|nr:D-2-hydroxyacid dehydrogenase [Anaerolineaceae bacterium]